MLRETPVVVGIDDRVLTLRQPYPAEGVAVPDPAIPQCRPDQYPEKPIRKLKCPCELDHQGRVINQRIGELVD